MGRILVTLALIALILSSLVGCATESQQPTVSPEGCEANFIVEPISAKCTVQGEGLSCTGTTAVRFIDKSTGNITAWAWDFNDGGNSTAKNPTHTYSSNGNYTITLTITTPDCQDKLTKQDYISITGCHT
jgi:PKD repeat protein